MSAFVPKYLDCRDLGHAWERSNDTTKTTRGAVTRFTRTVQCSRCSTIRKDEYQVGDTIYRRKGGYTYPPGYVVKGGMTRGEARMLLWMPRVEVAGDLMERRKSA